MVDPFCGVGTTCHAAMLLGRQGVGVEIDPNCMVAFSTLYRRIYHTSCPKFNVEVLPESKIGEHFVELVGSELSAESDVMHALMARYESLKQGPIDVRDSLLLATQMHIFRNVGFIFLKFCHDKHPFPKRAFKSRRFVDQYLVNASLSKADKEDRPDVDTFEGLFEMSERIKHHVDGFTYRALYMRFNVDSERRNPEGGADDASYGDSEDEEEEPAEHDSDIESADDQDVPADQFVTSPGAPKIDHMFAAAQSQGSPAKVLEFEESIRGSDDVVRKKKRELEALQKMMQERKAKQRAVEKTKETEQEPEKEPVDEGEKEPEEPAAQEEPQKEKKKKNKKKKQNVEE